MARKVCDKCKREMEDTNFYTYRSGQKVKMCKSCMTMHIDNFVPETFLWILKEMDVPYIPEEWDKLRDKAYAKNPQKMNGQSVIGKYLSKMKLKQWKKYTWQDSEKLQQESKKRLAAKQEEEQIQENLVKQQFERGQISEAQYRTLVSTSFQKQNEQNLVGVINPVGVDNMFNEDNFLPEDQIPDVGAELTDEDKQYLVMKWGRTYKAAEWVELEKTYTQMMNSFDIQDADSKNTLIFLCKTILKMNQAIDCGDVQGYQKLNKIYDAQRKSMKVTAAQIKQEKSDFVDSVGELVAYCEKQGGQIPRYEIDTPYDIVDKIINDLKEYNRTLIYEDSALARQIEDYLKEVRAARSKKKDEQQAKQQGYDVPQLNPEDTLQFKQFLRNEEESTKKIMEGSE